MATTATAAPGKTSFVKEFLQGNPQANAKAVNEAWTAAEMKGTISHPIISQVRKQLGLTGNLPGKTRTAAKEKAASNMPRTATVTPGKTSFVKQFLNANPQGTTKTVNEAWQAAGFEGTISPTLVNKTRVKLTGNLRGNFKTAAKEKSAPRLPKTATAIPGKTSFLKEFLHDNPQGNVKAANDAWTAAGFDGTISETLVYKTRASLGLTGNLSGKTKTAAEGKATPTGKKLGRPRKEPTAPVTGQPRGRKSARTLALTDLEADIDRLIFKVMGVGDLTEIEDSLRQARRLLYATANRG
jgi:nucleoid DNA-binding protein